MPPNVGIFGTTGSSGTPLTAVQANNKLDATTGTVSGQLLNGAVSVFENAGFIGTLDASLGALPSGLTPDGIAIRQGDYVVVTVAGTLPVGVTNGPDAAVGQLLTAKIDNPTTAADWVLSTTTVPITATAGQVVAVVANGQTSFALSPAPTNASSVVMEINGVRYFNVTDFTISGATVTWLNGFSLSTTDTVRFYYF